MAFLNKAQYLCEYFCESPIVIKRALKLFIDTAQESPFMVTVVLLSRWDSSIGGNCLGVRKQTNLYYSLNCCKRMMIKAKQAKMNKDEKR